ncbi:MAG: hypothetical protein V1712_02980 [Patescibacteria group bacterium]
MTKLYRDILARSWKILWKNPWMWLFGIFAAFAANTGEYASIISSYDKMIKQLGVVVALKHAIYTNEIADLGQGIASFLSQPVALSVIMLTALVVVILLAVWLVTVSQIGLIEASGRLGNGEPADFHSSFQSGVKHFWSVLWLNILTKFLIYLLLAVATLPFLISFLARPNEEWGFSWLFIIAFLIFIPLSLVVAFVIKYAIAFVVLKSKTWWEALEFGINLFLRNWLVSLEMAAVLFVIYILMGMVIYMILPTDMPLLVAELFSGFSLAIFLKLLPSLLAFIFIGAGYGAFQYIAWILLFDRLTEGTALAKLVRLTNEVPEYISQWFVENPVKTSKQQK